MGESIGKQVARALYDNDFVDRWGDGGFMAACLAIDRVATDARAEALEEAAKLAEQKDDGVLDWPDGPEIATAIRALINQGT